MDDEDSASSSFIWPGSRPELTAFFKDLFEEQPQVELRSVSGSPCAFINGQMFAGLYGGRIFIRLPEARRKELRSMEGSGIFSPTPDQESTEFSFVPQRMLSEPRELLEWLAAAMGYAGGLPFQAKNM